MKRVALAAAALLLVSGLAQAREPTVMAGDWAAYRAKFLQAEGRIVDDANGNISHSEGQGYGMLLAYLAGSRADFDIIWAFTRNEMLLRDDGLVAWKWDPNATPRVTDPNNATDGDILIAYALALAGKEWANADYSKAALGLIQAIREAAVVEAQGREILLPGVNGFKVADRPDDGPVINPSYWIFEAFPVFAGLDEGGGWDRLSRDGLAWLRQTRFGPRKLPVDWVSVRGRPVPAAGFPAEFGYNAVRIPLYLVRAGVKDVALIKGLGQGMSDGGDVVTSDIRTGNSKDRLADAGYRIIPALAACIADGTPVPAELRTFAPTNYYPSTLHLLSLSYLAQNKGAC